MDTKYSVLAIAIGVLIALIALPMVKKANILGPHAL